MRRLPPLNALKAFEALVRLRNLQDAAKELMVTPSAVHQQIKNLQKWAGSALFEGDGWILSEVGRKIYPDTQKAFFHLDSVAEKLLVNQESDHLRISVLPSFASQWLMARLARFAASHPEIVIELNSTNALTEYEKGAHDIGIRYGFGTYEDITATWLLPEALSPVCHPALWPAREKKTAIPETMRLLRDGGLQEKFSWKDWLSWAGMPIARITGSEYSDAHLTIQAALRKEGMILGRRVLVADLMAQGQLIAPFARWLPERAAYYIVHSRHRPLRKGAKLFISWLKKEAERFIAEDPILKEVSGPKSARSG